MAGIAVVSSEAVSSTVDGTILRVAKTARSPGRIQLLSYDPATWIL
jgi:hypothetical protein